MNLTNLFSIAKIETWEQNNHDKQLSIKLIIEATREFLQKQSINV